MAARFHGYRWETYIRHEARRQSTARDRKVVLGRLRQQPIEAGSGDQDMPFDAASFRDDDGDPEKRQSPMLALVLVCVWVSVVSGLLAMLVAVSFR